MDYHLTGRLLTGRLWRRLLAVLGRQDIAGQHALLERWHRWFRRRCRY